MAREWRAIFILRARMMPKHEILYEVVISVARERRDEYLDWLRPHMREMLGFDGFLSAELHHDSEDDCVFTASYRLRDRAAMDAYLAGRAAAMRADGVKRFGDSIAARRRILKAMAI
jgi:quinol monooxygenase YgiN